jgi:hypothetical protein
MRRALPALLLILGACGGPRYAVVDPPARPLSEFGSVEVKDVVVSEPSAPKDVREFAAWLTRNARKRLSPLFSGAGPKLVVTLTLDPSGLREQAGGWITPHWEGTAALAAAFRTEQNAPVAKVSAAAKVRSPSGALEPAGDALLDDVAAFVADASPR